MSKKVTKTKWSKEKQTTKTIALSIDERLKSIKREFERVLNQDLEMNDFFDKLLVFFENNQDNTKSHNTCKKCNKKFEVDKS